MPPASVCNSLVFSSGCSSAIQHATNQPTKSSQNNRLSPCAPRLICRAVTWGYAITAAICTVLGGFGYALYGSSTSAVITASLPPLSLIALLCTCLTLCNPFSAFALTLEPVALAVQQQLGRGQSTPYPVRAAIRLGK